MTIDAAILAAAVAAVVTIVLNVVNNRSESRRRRRDRERTIELEGIGQTRELLTSMLLWLSVSRDRAGVAGAGEIPNAIRYPRAKPSLTGDGPLIERYKEVMLTYMELPEGGGLTVEQRADIIGTIGALNRALDGQEARVVADKPLVKVTPQWEARLNAGMSEVARRTGTAMDEVNRRRGG